jgi:hypothetical protein
MKWNVLTHFDDILVGQAAPDGSSLVCKVCKVSSIYVAPCGARIYHVFGTTRLVLAFILGFINIL